MLWASDNYLRSEETSTGSVNTAGLGTDPLVIALIVVIVAMAILIAILARRRKY